MMTEIIYIHNTLCDLSYVRQKNIYVTYNSRLHISKYYSLRFSP